MARSTKKLNMAAMKEAAKELELKLPKGDPKVAAQALREFFTETENEESLAACGNCGWEAPDSFVSCPYCGTSLGESTEGPEPQADEGEKPRQKVAKKKGKGRGKGKTKAIQKIDPKKVAECDERVAKIKGFRRSIAEEAYNIGVELKEIHDRNLWRHKDYNSFSKFCEAELDYTRVMAYKYMSMAGAVKKEDAIALGVSKVDMIVNAPQKRQKKLLEMGKEGKSRKEMEDWLKTVEGKKGGGKGDADKITLVARANMGDTFLPWLGDKSGKETTRETKGKHVEFAEIVSGFVLYVREDDSGKGLVFTLKKISKDGEEPAENTAPVDEPDEEELDEDDLEDISDEEEE